MKWREVLSKRAVFSLVVILGLTAFGIAYLFIRSGSRCLHPEQSEVQATAWFESYPYGPDKLHLEIRLVELDVNDTYCFQSICLNPHYGEEPGQEMTCEAAATFGGCDKMSEGDVISITFPELGSEFELRNGNRVDVVLSFYILERVETEGGGVRYDHKKVGEIEFSVNVQGEIPPGYR